MKPTMLAMIFGVVFFTRSASAQCDFKIPDSVRVEADSTGNIFYAGEDSTGRQVIYYNPAKLRWSGEQGAKFGWAHEYGHIVLGHTKLKGLQDSADRVAIHHRLEMEADLFAIEKLHGCPGVMEAFPKVILRTAIGRELGKKWPLHPPPDVRLKYTNGFLEYLRSNPEKQSDYYFQDWLAKQPK